MTKRPTPRKARRPAKKKVAKPAPRRPKFKVVARSAPSDEKLTALFENVNWFFYH